MGFFQDLLFGRQQQAQYMGGPELQQAYGRAAAYRPMDYRHLMGQVGGGTLASASRDYMTSVMGGAGINPYESEAWKQHEAATMGQTREQLGGLASMLGGSGMLRGSGSERLAGDVIGQAQRGLAQQAFGAQQAGLGRQMQVGMFAPQMELQQQQFMGGLQQQDIQNQLAQMGLAGQLGGAISGAYGVPERGGGLMNLAAILAPIIGTAIGGPAGGAVGAGISSAVS